MRLFILSGLDDSRGIEGTLMHQKLGDLLGQFCCNNTERDRDKWEHWKMKISALPSRLRLIRLSSGSGVGAADVSRPEQARWHPSRSIPASTTFGSSSVT